MFTRRMICGCLAAVPFAMIARPSLGAEGDTCAVFTPARQRETSPAKALARLKAGNERFVSGKTINCDLLAQAQETAAGQAPFAAIVGCMDSRVPPELVFDQKIGDVFDARIAGNFVDTNILGSLEFATKVAGARLICILGHSDCGAIKGAIDNVELGNLTATLKNIRPAVEMAAAGGKAGTSKDPDFVQKVADANVALAERFILDNSPTIKEMVNAGSVRIVGAMNDLATGRVRFFES
ncbi:carbonic anhydrase family protein [Aurantimonas sp. VKM B-3413]|uniref:carbonic anhydrase family protein n=1 Tax=Aurantimonas sp. VKM B-3413 TaxID=2779401 RepID=UPI001E55AF00|nr:carbonic anhydrase family protein [Aurantimonas sp. VKM B-3413]MCB8837807.1 carbonic anhydrase [Aurantimonas sp. VKM B-3413]